MNLWQKKKITKKGRGILKILMFVLGGLFLIGAGLGAGFLMFGGTQSDPSEEIEQIIERKMIEAEEEKAAEEVAAEGEQKVAKETPEGYVYDYLFRISWYFYHKPDEVTKVPPSWSWCFHPI